MKPSPTLLPFILAYAALYVIFAVVTLGAEKDDKDSRTLYIYTSPRHCQPCRELESDIAAGKLPGFKVMRLVPPPGVSIPCIAYWKKDGKPGYFTGWGMGEEKKFLKQWKRDCE